MNFNGLNTSGEYEMRLYSADHQNDYGTVFVTSVPFTVGESDAAVMSDSNAAAIGDGKPKPKSESEALLTNFSIKLVMEADGQVPYYFYQAVCDKGWAFKLEGDDMFAQFLYVDYNSGAYELDVKNKTGEHMPYDVMFKHQGFYWYIAQYLFMHEFYMDDETFAKTGSDKILGRDTTVYTMTFGDGTGKFWIDNEYCFTLKYVQNTEDKMTAEVTEFIIGGITLSDMVNLGEYSITDVSFD